MGSGRELKGVELGVMTHILNAINSSLVESGNCECKNVYKVAQ